ncbi:MAG: radical SAM protein [Thermodesulfobacteriota bacterium]
MRIVLINPQCGPQNLVGRHGNTMVALPPLGLACIAAVLERAGHSVTVIDQYAEKINDQTVITRITEKNPHLVGFSCLTPAMTTVKNLSRKIKKVYPGTPVVLGNIHATIFASALIEQEVGDFVIHGEGENAIVLLAEVISKGGDLNVIPGLSFRENGKTVYTGSPKQVEDLDSLPYPAWHLMPVQAYKAHPVAGAYGVMLPIQGGRGCPYHCYFCSQNAMFRGVRTKSVTRIVNEIEYLHQSFGLQNIGFEDSIFPLSSAQAVEFCDEMIRRGLHKKICWLTETRVDMAEPALFKKMRRAGLSMVLFGIESADEKILARCGKTISPAQSEIAVKIAHDTDIKTLGLYILGLPGETRASALKTIRFALKLDTDFAKFNIAVPYPGSPFYEECCAPNNEEDLPYQKFTSWYMPKRNEKILHIPESMSQEELIRLQHLAMAAFWLRPSKIFSHLLKRSIPLGTMWKGFTAILGDTLESITLRRD